jgi:hypothetical protein
MALLTQALSCIKVHGNKAGEMVSPLVLAYLQMAAEARR